MGCTTTDSGVSIQLCNKDGSPDGNPIYGKYARLYGQRQDVLLAAKPATPDEDQFKGSDDWLTLIAVADSQEKLDGILAETKITNSAAYTSGSSHRACVELHVGETRQSFQDRTTIASGPITSLPPNPKMNVAYVKVLPLGATLGALGDDNPVLMEFIGGAVVLQILSQ